MEKKRHKEAEEDDNFKSKLNSKSVRILRLSMQGTNIRDLVPGSLGGVWEDQLPRVRPNSETNNRGEQHTSFFVSVSSTLENTRMRHQLD